METTRGLVGFTIPVQSQKQNTNLSLTPEDILGWRNHLPMADMGRTASQVYYALNDSNQVTLDPKYRFQILELFRAPVQFVCQSLRKHYINQMQALTEEQSKIVQLAETLQLEMTFGYKLVLEQGIKEESSEFIDTIIPIAIERLFHYYDHVLLRHYHLYHLVPEALWQEIHFLFEYAQNNNYLNHEKIVHGYKKILLMSLTDPYKWRQNEQDMLHEASDVWAKQVELRKMHSEPIVPNPQEATRTPSAPEKMRFLELTLVLNRIKNIISELAQNELQIKILHSQEPEYLIPISVLATIAQTWEKKPDRSERIAKAEQIDLCAGLAACHYYLSQDQSFSQKKSAATASRAPISFLDTIDLSRPSLGTTPEITQPFPLYSCKLVNENERGGAGLVCNVSEYPPLQPGELVGIRKKEDGGKFSLSMIRWKKHFIASELKFGTQRLATKAVAAALQLVKEDKKSGYFLRCIILDNSIITPILPFKAGSIALMAIGQESKLIKIELTRMLESTSSYKIFEFVKAEGKAKSKKQASSIGAPANTIIFPDALTKDALTKTEQRPSKKADDSQNFDSIWSKL